MKKDQEENKVKKILFGNNVLKIKNKYYTYEDYPAKKTEMLFLGNEVIRINKQMFYKDKINEYDILPENKSTLRYECFEIIKGSKENVVKENSVNNFL